MVTSWGRRGRGNIDVVTKSRARERAQQRKRPQASGPVTSPYQRQRRRRTRWALFGAMVVVIGTAAISGFVTSGGSTTTVPTVGHSAPAWSGTTLTGSALSSGSERGHWVILNFFATWCGPCQRETPQLASFAASKRARVVGVVYQDSAAAARAFVAAHPVTWPLVGDSSGTTSQHYDVVGLPLSFVINPHGQLVKELFGGVTVADLDAVVPPA